MKKKVSLKGRLKLYMMWPIYLCILLLPAVVAMYFFDVIAGYIMTGIFVVYAVIAIILFCSLRKKVLRSIVNFAMDYDDVQRKLLNEFELPYALLDRQGKMLWTNDKLRDLFHMSVISDKNILAYLTELKTEIFQIDESRTEQEVRYEDKDYRVVFES